MRKMGVLAFSALGVFIVLGLIVKIALGAPLRQDQPNGSTIVSPQNVNGTWGPGIITATGNVVINAGVVITVAPNTTIRVVGSRLFTINGNLHSDGPITFTSTSAVPGAWRGIIYAAGSTGYLNAATVQYARQAVTLNTANPITISNSVLRYNQHVPGNNQTAFGAGLAILQGNHLISGTYVYSNSITASGTGQAYGAGIYIAAGAPQIRNCWVYQNTATTTGNVNGAGGGIGMVGGAALIDNSYILTNTLSGGTGTSNSDVKSGGGIGIYANTSAIIRNSWIAANRVALTAGNAGGGGIGLGLNGTATRIEHNVIYANYVAGPYWCEGNGIDAWDTTNSVTIVNNLIVSNTAGTCGNGSPYGGGMNLNANATGVYVINNTIVGNQATNGRGGGVYLQGGSPVVSNNIIANNTASSGGGVYRDVGTADYNDIFGNTPQNTVGTVGVNNVYLDPLFLGAGDLAQWYHLRQGSPAIDDGTNTATGLPADDYDGDARPLGATWDIGFDEIRSITLTKAVTPTIAGAGDTLIYTLVISNPDRIAPLIGGVLSDTMPPSTTYASGPSCASGTCSYNVGNQTITWNTDLSASNQTLLTYAVTANASVPRGVPITNSFQIPLGSGIRSSNVVTTLLVPRVSFSSATYGVTESAGTAIITVTLDARSLLPVTVNYATSNGTATAPSDYLTSIGTLTFTAGVTTATFSVPIVNDVIAEPNETVTLTLSGPGNAVLGSPNPATLIIIDSGIANLQINKSASPAVVPSGGILTYTLTYANAGLSGALAVRITDTLPSGVTWGGVTSAVPPITLTGTTPPAWFTPTLALGASGTIVFTTTVTAPGGSVLTNQAVITSTTNETITTDNIAMATTTVGQPVLMISKSGDPDPVIIGDQLNYTINYTNTGTGPATNVVVVETYDPNVSFISAVPAPSSGNTTWNIGTLNAGQSGSIAITVVVNGGASLTNQVNISSAEGASASASVSTVVVPPGQVRINKSVTPTFFTGAGQPVTYTIMITNTGGAVRVRQITDTLPAGFTYSGTLGTTVIRFPDSINVNGQTVTWAYGGSRPTIPAGSTATLAFVATTGATAACNSAGVTIQGSIGVVADDGLACLSSNWPEYFITAQAGSQTIRVRVRLVNGLPVILSWEFLP